MPAELPIKVGHSNCCNYSCALRCKDINISCMLFPARKGLGLRKRFSKALGALGFHSEGSGTETGNC